MKALEWALDKVAFVEQELKMKPRIFQRQILESNSTRIYGLCHRQAGKSELAAMIACHRLIYTTGHSVIASPTFRQTERVARRVKKFLSKCSHCPVLVVDNKFFIETEIGSSLSIISLEQPDNIRGLSGVSWLCIDELCMISHEQYAALVPAMASIENSAQLLCTTPKAQIGLAWELFNNPSYQKFTLRASDNPEISKSWLEKEKEAMGVSLWNQEYEIVWGTQASCVFDLNLFYEALDPKISAVAI